MEIILILASIIQFMSISLGVGSSTLAIVNFFVAIADGTIDQNERRMMGVVYVVLRVAMVLILLSTISLWAINTLVLGNSLTAFIFSEWIVVGILFINAALMTAHRMPSTIGPALQAGSWYTLGILLALLQLGLSGFTLLQFVFGYVSAIALSVSVVNGIMALLHTGTQKHS